MSVMGMMIVRMDQMKAQYNAQVILVAQINSSVVTIDAFRCGGNVTTITIAEIAAMNKDVQRSNVILPKNLGQSIIISSSYL